jgi:hypothetical protein
MTDELEGICEETVVASYRHCSAINLQGMQKTVRMLSLINWYPAPLEHKRRALECYQHANPLLPAPRSKCPPTSWDSVSLTTSYSLKPVRLMFNTSVYNSR